MINPNLRTRSAYTFFGSLLKIDDIINHALDNGFSNAFLIDKEIMYGAQEFYNKCIRAGIKPIIGIEFSYKGKDVVAIPEDNVGYKNLLKLSSFVKLEKEINISDFSNLIILENLPKAVLVKSLIESDTLKDFHSVTGKEFNEDFTGFLSREEFSNLNSIELLTTIDDVVNNVNLVIEERVNVLPSFKVDGNKVESKSYLENKLKENLVKILNSNKSLNRDEYIERTSYEFKVISEMNFEDYFLIVADIIEWSKSQGIMVGPGRGSAPGSLISYLLGITTVDPIENNLIFERFLNPDRVTMPDIDIDFEDTRRDEVIQYIAEKYGNDNVAQIITFQTLKAKMSFKDMGRIKGLAASEANAITKLIPEDSTLEEAYESTKSFREKIDSTQMLTDIFNSAKLIENLPRQFSTHAAGIVLSDKPIWDSVPAQKGYGSMLQTQYSMDHMEVNGLLKIDILGLRNLSFIKETLFLIKENKGIDISLKDIDFNDSKVYSYLAAGKTSGVFQLESPGMKTALRDIRVSTFEDVVATTSLFRPGPMKMIPDFAKRKRGEVSVDYLDEKTEEILGSTYGVIVYQEQIMKLAQAVSNFTLSKADILRRAIGKKDMDLLTSLKSEFISGGIDNGYDETTVQKMYDLIYEFSNYGFNRSHAFAYTTISYWLAWLKINYKIEFMTSLLNSVSGNTTKTPEYISEAEDLGVEILMPSIFNSRSDYRIIDGKVYVGLRTIKGVGESLIKSITLLQANINSDITLANLFIEFDRFSITQSSIETLIKSGALNSFGYNVKTLLEYIPRISEYIKMIKVTTTEIPEYKIGLVPEPMINVIAESNDLNYFKEVMGFSLNNKELFNQLQDASSELNLKIHSLENLNQDEQVEFVGEIISIRPVTTKNGQQMAFLSIDNGMRKVSGTVWPATFSKYSNKFVATNRLAFYGKADLKRNETIIINKVEEI